MHIISVDHLKPGDILGRSLYTESFELLLAAGYRVNETIIRKIRDRGYLYVYVMDGIADDIVPEEMISDAVRMSAHRALKDTFDELQENRVLSSIDPGMIKKRLDEDTQLHNLVNVISFSDMASNLVDELFYNNIFLFASLPVLPQETQHFEHAIDTALLSIILCMKLDLNFKDVRPVATAALLHDIGKAIVLNTISGLEDNSPGESSMLQREHPTFSMLLVRGSDSGSFREQLIIEEHHERLNGSGYPLGIRGEDVPPGAENTTMKRRGERRLFRLSQILAVANRYDNLIAGRVDPIKYTPEEAVEKIEEGMGTLWNSYVVKALRQVIQPYPVGARVVLKKAEFPDLEGCSGIVIRTNPDTPEKPIIVLTHGPTGEQMNVKEVDCSKDGAIKLELVL